MLLTLGMEMWVKSLLSVGFLFVSIILILTVLIQRPSGGGLSGAFGAASGSGQTAFGAKTGDALTIFTIIMFVIFVLGGIGMKFVSTPSQPGAPPAMTSGSGEAETAPATQPPPADVGGPARSDGPPVQGPGLLEVDPEEGDGGTEGDDAQAQPQPVDPETGGGEPTPGEPTGEPGTGDEPGTAGGGG